MRKLYKKIENAEIGDSLWDAHDGTPMNVITEQGYELVDSMVIPGPGGKEHIESIVRSERVDDLFPWRYTNKLAVIIAENQIGNLVIAYSYDDRFTCFMTIDKRSDFNQSI